MNPNEQEQIDAHLRTLLAIHNVGRTLIACGITGVFSWMLGLWMGHGCS